MLTARREERLRSLTNDPEARHEISTRVVPLDLVADDAPRQLDEATADLDVGFVLNNAGFGVAGRLSCGRTSRKARARADQRSQVASIPP